MKKHLYFSLYHKKPVLIPPIWAGKPFPMSISQVNKWCMLCWVHWKENVIKSLPYLLLINGNHSAKTSVKSFSLPCDERKKPNEPSEVLIISLEVERSKRHKQEMEKWNATSFLFCWISPMPNRMGIDFIIMPSRAWFIKL